MRLTAGVIAGLGLAGAMLHPAQASAEAKIYAYSTSANYCPAGLQPITISGVICCGTPNQSMSYQQVKSHPVKTRHKVRRHQPHRASYECPIGEKGCR